MTQFLHLAIVAVVISMTFMPSAFATHPAGAPDLLCWELGTCGEFASDPLSVMLTPFDSVFAGFSIVVFWGLLCGILWLRSHNPMMVGMVGVAMVGAYMASDAVVLQGATPQFHQAHAIGVALIAISLFIALWHIVLYRIQSGPQ